jgi:hypothetical protein
MSITTILNTDSGASSLTKINANFVDLDTTKADGTGTANGTNTGDGTYGIANTNYVKIDSADVASGEFARFTANGLEGRTNAEVLSSVGALPLAGGTMSGNITLGENTSIALDPAGSADGKYSGITVTGTGGTTIAFGDLIYLAVADSRWELADADAATTAGGVMLGMAVSTSTDGNPVTVLLQGIIRADAAFPALTIGAAVYVGETAGDIQVAIPTGADNIIRVVGFALTADEIYFNPSQDSQVTVA